MGKWFPRMYDIGMKPFEKNRFNKIRTTLINKAGGRVLEVGYGSGVNFPYYKNKNIEQVDAVEPNPLMRQRALEFVNSSPISIQTYSAKAENLPFEDDTFDSVVATLVFCTIPDPVRALEEIQRVSKPGAKILLFEHVRMNQKMLAKIQDVLTPLWSKVCDGCHLNRDTFELLNETRIDIKQVDYYFKSLFITIEGINDDNNHASSIK